MAGLLDDIFNTPEGRLGIGLLSMAGAQPRPMGFGERLAGAFQMQDAYKQQLADEESRKLRNEFQSEQMQGMRSRAAQERAAMEAAMRKQQALPSLLGEAGVDVQGALSAGFSPEEIKGLGGLRNVNANKVARTVKGIGQDGREYEYQVDEFGNRVGEGLAQFRAPLLQNLGDKTVALDPYTLQQKQSFAMGMSPESRASNALGWANNALARQRLEMESAKNAGDGYTFSPQLGGYVPKVPGGEFKPLAGLNKQDKPLTESQSKSLLFGSRMEEANKIIDQAAAAGVERPSNLKGSMEAIPFIGGTLGALANATPIVSKEEQMLEQAQRDFVNAVLRKESGAVIGVDEFENAKKQYFPAFGDSKEVIKQKKANRELATKLLLQEAGQKTSEQPKTSSSRIIDALPTPNASNKGKRVRDTSTGQILVSDGMQWRPE